MAPRVLTSFNELLTRPNPRPITDYSPIEGGLARLWNVARELGAPLLIGWANQLVVEYVSNVEVVRRWLLAYSVVTIGVVAGIGIAMPTYVMRQLTNAVGAEAVSQLRQYWFLGDLAVAGYLTSLGGGFLAGSMLLDHRTASLLAGALGLTAWLALHQFFGVL